MHHFGLSCLSHLLTSRGPGPTADTWDSADGCGKCGRWCCHSQGPVSLPGLSHEDPAALPTVTLPDTVHALTTWIYVCGLALRPPLHTSRSRLLACPLPSHLRASFRILKLPLHPGSHSHPLFRKCFCKYKIDPGAAACSPAPTASPGPARSPLPPGPRQPPHCLPALTRSVFYTQPERAREHLCWVTSLPAQSHLSGSVSLRAKDKVLTHEAPQSSPITSDFTSCYSVPLSLSLPS